MRDTVPIEVDGETYRVERGQATLWIGERYGYRVRLLWGENGAVRVSVAEEHRDVAEQLVAALEREPAEVAP